MWTKCRDQVAGILELSPPIRRQFVLRGYDLLHAHLGDSVFERPDHPLVIATRQIMPPAQLLTADLGYALDKVAPLPQFRSGLLARLRDPNNFEGAALETRLFAEGHVKGLDPQPFDESNGEPDFLCRPGTAQRSYLEARWLGPSRASFNTNVIDSAFFALHDDDHILGTYWILGTVDGVAVADLDRREVAQVARDIYTELRRRAHANEVWEGEIGPVRIVAHPRTPEDEATGIGPIALDMTEIAEHDMPRVVSYAVRKKVPKARSWNPICIFAHVEAEFFPSRLYGQGEDTMRSLTSEIDDAMKSATGTISAIVIDVVLNQPHRYRPRPPEGSDAIVRVKPFMDGEWAFCRITFPGARRDLAMPFADPAGLFGGDVL